MKKSELRQLIKEELHKKIDVQELSSEIFEFLNKKGAGLGSVSIILIEKSIEDYFRKKGIQ